eukprot:6992945-Karenia_brevis.AAC.1
MYATIVSLGMRLGISGQYRWETGAIMATTVTHKGGRDEVGDAKREILIKSDTEEAMKMLM